MINKTLSIFICFSLIAACGSNDHVIKSTNGISIMFYNVENLFDTVDDPKTHDEDFLPNSDKKWDAAKYKTKIRNLAEVVLKINNGSLPDLLGVCEIENKTVLSDLNSTIKGTNYAISHFDSPDRRGIDVGLFYNTNKFNLINKKAIDVKFSAPRYMLDKLDKKEAMKLINKHKNSRTRDILKTNLSNGSDTFCVLVCHFPSRREGKEESAYKRNQVATILRDAIETEKKLFPNTTFIIMGDFNDEPLDNSMKNILKAGKNDKKNTGLINLFYEQDEQNKGSYKYRGKMNMLDQIIISKTKWSTTVTSRIYSPSWLTQTGKYAGYPLRTFGGKNYLGGYSDHFPVFATINNK